MSVSRALSVVILCLPLALSACAGKPDRINNVCSVFDQNDGWFGNWRWAAGKASRKYNIPMPILMATIRMESGFDGRARPPRKKILGFIPGGRISSAYGYSQALDGTWSEYKSKTGNYTARRSNFSDAVDFVGWYHDRSARTLGISRNDAYNLYLAYYSGPVGYRRGAWRNNAAIQKHARRTEAMANSYAAQLRSC